MQCFPTSQIQITKEVPDGTIRTTHTENSRCIAIILEGRDQEASHKHDYSSWTVLSYGTVVIVWTLKMEKVRSLLLKEKSRNIAC